MKIIDPEIVEQLKNDAMRSPRLRSHFLLHASHDDKVQRLLICFAKGSVVDPHYHENPEQWEMFAVLQGSLKVTIHSFSGDILNHCIVSADSSLPQLVEIAPSEIHSVECLSEFALMLEIKEGPFDSSNAKTFPNWM